MATISMKFAIMGAGGVGGYYAGVLKKAGNTVYVLARGNHLERIKNDGLTVLTQDDKFTVALDLATDSIDDMNEVDAVLVAVKAWQVEDLVNNLSSVVADDTIIIPLQNGVEAYGTLKNNFPKQTVGGLTRIISLIESPGRIRHIGAEPYIAFGKEGGEVTEKMLAISDAFVSAGIHCEISVNILKDIWEKFLIMATFGGIGSITQAPIGILRSIEETRKMIEISMDEVIELANSMGIDLNNNSRKRAWDFLNSLPDNGTSSTQRDIGSGRPSEIYDLSGAVMRLGKKYNVNVPLHDFIYKSLVAKEMKARGKLSF